MQYISMSKTTSILVRIAIVILITIAFIWMKKCERQKTEQRLKDKEHLSFTGVLLSKEEVKITCFKVLHFDDKTEHNHCSLAWQLESNFSIGDTIIKFEDENRCQIKNAKTDKLLTVPYY